MHDILMDEHEMAEFLQLQNQPQPQQPQQPIFDYRQQGDFAYTNTNVKLAQQPQQSLKKFEVASSSSESPTPSSRKASSAQQAAKLENESSWVSSETQLFSFPPRELVLQGIDPVAFMVRDVRTLDRKEFVNDNVMAFMLNYIAVNMIDKELMNKIHLCNTFFYSNLTRSLPTLCFSRRKPIEAEHNVTLVENCSRVLRWTKKFDVFSKDYIVIPVNEDYHWLLITVFNPAGAIVNLSSEDESRKAPMCYVAFFDPLSGLDPTKKNHMCYCVKTYLAELYDKTKTAGKRFASADNTAFDPDRVIITNPKNLPIQSNFYDCGLYTLHFIEGLFCYLNRPVTVKDFPNFDWSALYPAANEMADLMRDKIYNLVLKVSDQRAKQRLSRYEKNQSTGLSQEGNLRKGRRHSADRVRKTPRHGEYRQRRYSVNPPSRAVMEDPMFLNPRAMVEMPATRRVRALRLPEENFPVIY
uniref:ULP_PROTEASE domain-containing protein n=1 Tax=Caenorhabditis japonica TaxID=281687 RepID=A0A8R1E030_CAEJA